MIRSNGFHFDIIESYDEINIYITNSSQDTIISNLSFKNLDRYPSKRSSFIILIFKLRYSFIHTFLFISSMKFFLTFTYSH